jgi:hypothetical protein
MPRPKPSSCKRNQSAAIPEDEAGDEKREGPRKKTKKEDSSSDSSGGSVPILMPMVF